MGGKNSKPIVGGEQYILVMGLSGAGKTTFINRASGSDLKTSNDILSCTLEDQISNPFEYNGRTIRMIDTIGFENPEATDAQLRLDLHTRLGRLGGIKSQLIGIIYLHDISILRVGNSAIRMVDQLKKTIGKTAAQNIVVVTTKWDLIDEQDGNRRQERLSTHPKVFGTLTKKGMPVLKYKDSEGPFPIIDRLLIKA